MPTILCIDDQPDSLFIRKLFLESLGYDVVTAVTGRDGIDLCARQSPDLVLLDFRLPDMDGEAVARTLRQQSPQLPIILLTGYPLTLPRGVNHCVNAVVVKGSPTNELLDELQKLLGAAPRRKLLDFDDVTEASIQQARQGQQHVQDAAAHTRHINQQLRRRRHRG